MNSAHAHRDGLGVGRQSQGLGAGDYFLVIEVEQVLVEAARIFREIDIVAKLADLVFHDVFGRDRPTTQNLHGGTPAVAVTRDGETLRMTAWSKKRPVVRSQSNARRRGPSPGCGSIVLRRVRAVHGGGDTWWPVSAARKAILIVSLSRSSPTRITSGSCRKACLSPCSNEGVSWPSSSCETMAFWLVCMYSTGSSMVMILQRKEPLIRSTIAAKVVLLPLPVVPVSSVIPRSDSVISRRTVGSFRSSSVRILSWMVHALSPAFPCGCRCCNGTGTRPVWRMKSRGPRPAPDRVARRSVPS